jgi:hypothetical protein
VVTVGVVFVVVPGDVLFDPACLTCQVPPKLAAPSPVAFRCWRSPEYV